MAHNTEITRRNIPAPHIIVKIEEWKRQRREQRPRVARAICPTCDGRGCERCFDEGTIEIVIY